VLGANSPLPKLTVVDSVLRYETVTANFQKYPNSLLARMFSPENMNQLTHADEKGEYFIGSLCQFRVLLSSRILSCRQFPTK
jgi:hypothetical protein